MQGAGAAVLSLSASGSMKAQNNSTHRPNIVFISSDNQSYQDTGYAGHSIVKTPNLDIIVQNGVIFSSAYCGSPVCAPSRASMMTGMYPSDSNSFCNATPWDGTYPTWGSRLRKAGYYTRSIGKLDLDGSIDTGFEEFEASHGHAESPDITALFRRPVCYRIGERLNVNGGPRQTRHTDAYWTELAIDFLATEAPGMKKPWVLNVGLHEPHVAYFERAGFLALEQYYTMYPPSNMDMPNVPPGHLEALPLVMQRLRHFKRLATPIPEDRIRKAKAGYYGLISELDEYVGRIWSALEQTGQLDNTIVIFTADNGMCMGEHGLFYHNNLYEEATRVPLLMAGGGLPAGVEIDTPVTHADAVASILEWCGADIPAGFRGHSLCPLLEGRMNEHPGYAYSENHSEGNCTGSFMVRKGDWKYIHFTWYDDVLFNLTEDPGEFHNRIDDPGTENIQQELKEILHSIVNPEQVTLAAFRKQEKLLYDMSVRMTEDELYSEFEFRLGPGQARALAAKCKKS